MICVHSTCRSAAPASPNSSPEGPLDVSAQTHAPHHNLISKTEQHTRSLWSNIARSPCTASPTSAMHADRPPLNPQLAPGSPGEPNHQPMLRSIPCTRGPAPGRLHSQHSLSSTLTLSFSAPSDGPAAISIQPIAATASSCLSGQTQQPFAAPIQPAALPAKSPATDARSSHQPVSPPETYMVSLPQQSLQRLASYTSCF
jgi:hypothetical protein